MGSVDAAGQISTHAFVMELRAAHQATGRFTVAARERKVAAEQASRAASGEQRRTSASPPLGGEAYSQPGTPAPREMESGSFGGERTTAARLLGRLIHHMGGAANSTSKGTFVNLLV